MPTLRLLADAAFAIGSPGSRDVDGYARFPVGPGDTVPLTMDCVGWLGGETLTGSAWSSGLALSGAANSGGIATALAAVPVSSTGTQSDPLAYPVTHTATASGGRVRVTKLYLVA